MQWISAPSGGLIKNFAKPGFLSIVFLSIAAMVRRMMFLFGRIAIRGIAGLWRWSRTYACGGPLNQFVEFAAI